MLFDYLDAGERRLRDGCVTEPPFGGGARTVSPVTKSGNIPSDQEIRCFWRNAVLIASEPHTRLAGSVFMRNRASK